MLFKRNGIRRTSPGPFLVEKVLKYIDDRPFTTAKHTVITVLDIRTDVQHPAPANHNLRAGHFQYFNVSST